MLPKRRSAFTVYEFCVIGGHERIYGRRENLDRPYEVYFVRFEVGSRNQPTRVVVQGKILATDPPAVAQVFAELASTGAKKCNHPEHSWATQRGFDDFGTTWQYCANFCLTMNSLRLIWDRKISKDQAVWNAYQDLARELGFLAFRPDLTIYHRFQLLVDHHWLDEGGHFGNRNRRFNSP